jgi:hypothetical protein
MFEAVPGAEVKRLAVLLGCPPSLLHDVFLDRVQVHIVPEGDVTTEGVSAAVALDYVCHVSLYHIVTIIRDVVKMQLASQSAAARNKLIQ